MSQEMLIKNGTVVFESDIRKADLYIKDEKIAAIFEPGMTPAMDCKKIDATGLYVMPGAIDPHQHLGLYNSFEESYRYSTARDVIGGLTSIVEYHRGKGNYFDTVSEEIAINKIKLQRENAGREKCDAIFINDRNHSLIEQAENFINNLKY